MLILSIQLHIFFLVELGKSASTTTASDFIEVLKYRGARTQNCARAHPHSHTPTLTFITCHCFVTTQYVQFSKAVITDWFGLRQRSLQLVLA